VTRKKTKITPTTKRLKIKKRAWKFAWEIFAGFALILGLPGTLEFYVPAVIVTQSDPVDPSNAFSAAFTVSSISKLPLQNVTVGFALGELMIGRLYPRANTPPNFASVIVPSAWSEHTLSPNERCSITPADLWSLAPGSNLEYADIGFVVFYHSWFDQRRHRALFRFQTKRQSNGRLYWYPAPVS
jgi:hypothetical protein